ncbi:innexin inx3-like [Penaeus monodon]|uniref:innexin inx3-like n=1 Tax=Penaeus monodon TaxID=6687 RepID=UPI0018A6F255|nr:innexin inx3-like [Penaeus monodon]
MARQGLLSAVLGAFRPNAGADMHSANFKVHFQLTPKLTFSFLLLVIAYHVFGEPLRCFSQGLNYSEKALNDYCWAQNTFILKRRQLGPDVAHPGIINDDDEQRYYHLHFQLVPLVLFLQGLVFYIPNWLWKGCEGGRLRSLSAGLCVPFLDKEMRLQKIQASLSTSTPRSINPHLPLATYKHYFWNTFTVLEQESSALCRLCNIHSRLLGGITLGIEALHCADFKDLGFPCLLVLLLLGSYIGMP